MIDQQINEYKKKLDMQSDDINRYKLLNNNLNLTIEKRDKDVERLERMLRDGKEKSEKMLKEQEKMVYLEYIDK